MIAIVLMSFLSLLIFIPVEIIMNNKKVSLLLSVFVILILCTLSMFRGSHFADTTPYILYYSDIANHISEQGFFAVDGRYGIGFEIITRIFCFLRLNYHFFFFAISLFNFTFIYIIVSKFTKYKCTALLIFASFYGIYFSYVILRAGIATLLVVYAICCQSHRKFLLNLIFAIALLFHISLIYAIAIYYIVRFIKNDFSKTSVIFDTLLFAILIVFYQFGLGYTIMNFSANLINTINISFLPMEKIYYYLNDFNESLKISISYKFLFYIIIFLIFKYYYQKSDKKTKIINNIGILIYIAILSSCMIGSGTLGGRLNDQLLVFVPLVFSIMVFDCKIFKEKRLQTCLLSIMFCLIQIFFLFRFIIQV